MFKNKNAIAIIPARKNSKRVLKKNIKKFNGQPIISYTIKAAIDSKLFNYIAVSTDCEVIANTARKFGASVDFLRSKKLSDDFTNTNDVIRDTLNFYEKKNKKFDYTCCIYPASPFINHKNLIKAYKILINQKKNMILTVQEFPSAIDRAFKIEKNKIKCLKKNFFNKNSNKLNKYYYDSGQFYFGTTAKFKKKKNIIDSKTEAIIINKYSSIDINDIEDWKFAEKLIKVNN